MRYPLNRREFARYGAGLLTAAPLLAQQQPADSFRFGVIADSHIIDSYYTGPEGNAEDTESIRHSEERLTSARDHLNSLRPNLEQLFLVGDYFHDYPSRDIDFYYKNTTRIDNAKTITDRFQMPVHVGFGNHDYGVPNVSREMSHELFRRKLGITTPYYAVEHKGFKFVHLNNFLGYTWEAGHEKYNKSRGSLGEAQLNWFEAQLLKRKPTFVFIHFPLEIVEATERADYGLHPLLKKHRETVQLVISGHRHKWMEFGRTYGPQHLVMAATRYDPDAYLVIEVDRKAASHRLLNLGVVDWNTHFSERWSG